MNGTWYKIMFELIKKIFTRLFTGIAGASNSLINLHRNACSHEFHH